MKQIEFPTLDELKKQRHAPIINRPDGFCGIAFNFASERPIWLEIHLVFSPVEFFVRHIEVVNIKPRGISSNKVMCFEGRICTDAPGGTNQLRLNYEVVQFLTGKFEDKEINTNDCDLNILVFIDLVTEEAVMIADDGRYNEQAPEDDIPF